MFKSPLKSVFTPFVTTVSLAAMLFFGNAISVTNAQNGNNAAVAEAQQPNIICQIEMRQFLFQKIAKFRNFIDSNFENKSSTGSLLQNGFDKYEEMRTEIYKKLEEFQPAAGAIQSTEAIEITACSAQVQDTLKQARELLERKAVTTSAVKRTTAILEKYQQINNKLAELNGNLIYMKSQLETFARKVPCYIDYCI